MADCSGGVPGTGGKMISMSSTEVKFKMALEAEGLRGAMRWEAGSFGTLTKHQSDRGARLFGGLGLMS